ncbi:hypothetical protein CZ787_18715 [Halomonas citrativorans]|uniref:Uncharacterized protein n=1 Tax=Halomonas citrativorans TaxID=2742612 RepID=A0A1R4I5Q1_9GAMM|nr:hypothetical protein CZ787_18715 [Halomonas citrativorans]
MEALLLRWHLPLLNVNLAVLFVQRNMVFYIPVRCTPRTALKALFNQQFIRFLI